MEFTFDFDRSFSFVHDKKVHAAKLQEYKPNNDRDAYCFRLHLDGVPMHCSVVITRESVIRERDGCNPSLIPHYTVQAIKRYGLGDLPEELALGSLDLPYSELGPQGNVDNSLADKTIAQHLDAFFYHEPDRDVRIYDLEISTCGLHSLVLKRLKFLQIKGIVEVIDDKHCRLTKGGWDKLQGLQ